MSPASPRSAAPDRDGYFAVLATPLCAIMAAMEELEIHSKVGLVTAKDLVSTNLYSRTLYVGSMSAPTTPSLGVFNRTRSLSTLAYSNILVNPLP